MSIDWESQSIELMFSEWVEAPDALRSFWGSWEQLPDTYRQTQAQHLTEAVKAAAFANLRNASSIEHFDWMAKRSYGRALAGLSEVMKSNRAAMTTETLTAINALATYEVPRSHPMTYELA